MKLCKDKKKAKLAISRQVFNNSLNFSKNCLIIAIDVSSKNQCTLDKERVKPTDSSIVFFLHPIMLYNVFSRGAMPTMGNF